MNRIAVIGVTGSGKTTFANQLAQILLVPHVELDALHWMPTMKLKL
jgi:adenylate kinase family enzyme